MIIWSRLGILALIIPIAIGFLIQRVMELTVEEPIPARASNPFEQSNDSATDDDIKQIKAGLEKKKIAAGVEHQRQIARAKNIGFSIGCFISAIALWPLGRWINKIESTTTIDATGQIYEIHQGGGHTLFFIPMQYWSIIWCAIGVYKLIK